MHYSHDETSGDCILVRGRQISASFGGGYTGLQLDVILQNRNIPSPDIISIIMNECNQVFHDIVNL